MIGVLKRFLVKRPVVDGNSGVGETRTVRSVIVKKVVNAVKDDENNAASDALNFDIRCRQTPNHENDQHHDQQSITTAGGCRDCKCKPEIV